MLDKITFLAIFFVFLARKIFFLRVFFFFSTSFMIPPANKINVVNRLTFKRNKRVGTVIYEMWRLHAAPWGIIGTTRRQVYIDAPV